MKHLKLAIIALFTLAIVGSANAQDANNPWVVGFGMWLQPFAVYFTKGFEVKSWHCMHFRMFRFVMEGRR